MENKALYSLSQDPNKQRTNSLVPNSRKGWRARTVTREIPLPGLCQEWITHCEYHEICNGRLDILAELFHVNYWQDGKKLLSFRLKKIFLIYSWDF